MTLSRKYLRLDKGVLCFDTLQFQKPPETRSHTTNMGDLKISNMEDFLNI